MNFIKSLRLVLLGVAMAAATLSSVEPASALGGCGCQPPSQCVGPMRMGWSKRRLVPAKDGSSRHLRGPWNWRCFR